MTGKTTICILFVDRQELLGNCLLKLLGNTHHSVYERILIITENPDIAESTFTATGEEIEIVEVPKGISIGAKKEIMLKNVETPYFTKLDSDVMVGPIAIDSQIRTLENDPCVGAVSGLTYLEGEKTAFTGVAFFKTLWGHLIKWRVPTKTLFNKLDECMYFDHLPEGHTTFRTEMFDDVSYDPGFEVGYSHWDLFYQIKNTEWKCAFNRYSAFDHRHQDSPLNYKQFHSEKRINLIEKSREYFISKWDLIPVDVNSRDRVGAFLHVSNTILERLRSDEPLFRGAGSYYRRWKTGVMEIES